MRAYNADTRVDGGEQAILLGAIVVLGDTHGGEP